MQKDGYIAGTDRKQPVLFPDTIDDYITPDNPVRFIDAFVDALDLKGMGFTHSEPCETGRPLTCLSLIFNLYDHGDCVKTRYYLQRNN